MPVIQGRLNVFTCPCNKVPVDRRNYHETVLTYFHAVEAFSFPVAGREAGLVQKGRVYLKSQPTSLLRLPWDRRHPALAQTSLDPTAMPSMILSDNLISPTHTLRLAASQATGTWHRVRRQNPNQSHIHIPRHQRVWSRPCLDDTEHEYSAYALCRSTDRLRSRYVWPLQSGALFQGRCGT